MSSICHLQKIKIRCVLISYHCRDVLLSPQHSPLIIALVYHYDELVSDLRHHFGDKHFAQDVVHDVCVQLIEHPPREAIRTPFAFLRQAVKHRAIDRCRQHMTQQRYIAEAQTLGQDSSHYHDGARALAFMQKLEALKCIIERLPDRQRQIFLLHRLHAMPQQEIADAIGISRNMVTQHFNRALASIQMQWSLD